MKQHGFQTTYEELKQAVGNGAWSACYRLSDYLWGIETGIFFIFAMSHLKLSDYLWGIETHSYKCDKDWIWRFQTTYEELKQSAWCTAVSITSASFQTTYEELKRTYTRIFGSRLSFAFRLPMRNWNRGRWLRSMTILCFQTTYEELKRRSSNNRKTLCFGAFRLPMRNWNR